MFKVRLLRNTKWKCGRIEKAIVNFLLRKGKAVLFDSLTDFRKAIGIKTRYCHFYTSLKRLQSRFIVKVERIS